MGIITAAYQPAPQPRFSIAASTVPVILIRAPVANSISMARRWPAPLNQVAAPESSTTLAGTKAHLLRGDILRLGLKQLSPEQQ
jgi:hypothetical protein